ncbi:hypothetical protein ACQPUZ_10650 [Clostridium tertium]
MTIQQKLDKAIELYGVGDIRTLELSEERDKEIEAEQRLIYERYKQCIA